MSDQKPAGDKSAVENKAAVAEAPAKTAVKPAATSASETAAKPAAKKPGRLEETRARNKKALAEALVLARAVKIPPASAKPLAPLVKSAPGKGDKARKVKLVRSTFRMPEAEFAQIAALRKRIAGLGGDVKKSEVLRAGLALLAALENKELAAVLARVERVRTGRPKK